MELKGEDERRLAYEDYCRHFKEWFAELSDQEQNYLRELGCDKPEPYDYPRARTNSDDDDEFFDPADLAIDPIDPRKPIVDFSVGDLELREHCDHFSTALVWITTGNPDMRAMGERILAVLRVMRPEAVRVVKKTLPKKMMADARRALSEVDPIQTGIFFANVLEWVCECNSLIGLGKRGFAAIYVLRSDLINAATCATIGAMDEKSRQAANKPVQEFRDSFKGINSLPMRANKTRNRCKQAQLKK